MPSFDLLSTGNEVVSGDIVDTNSAWLCQQFFELGLRPGRLSTVGDEFPALCEALAEAAERSDVVVVTGGLGPTTDDLSREVAAKVFGMPLIQDPVALEQIASRYARFGRPMTPGCYLQALRPDRAALIENPWGTAPGFSVDTGKSVVFFLPGVPGEMNKMFAASVSPQVQLRLGLKPRKRHVLRCMGLAESVANERMAGFSWPGVVVGYRAAMPEVHVKLELEPDVDGAGPLEDAKNRLGKELFGVDCGPLEEVVAAMLKERGQTVAVAESCTSGRLAAALTVKPGASAFFLGGALVYSNAEKIRACGVDPGVLASEGAVSEAVARQLAEGVRKAVGSDLGIGVTGIAGPDGGSAEKPVGTVHIAVASAGKTTHRKLLLPGDRERVMRFSVGAALELLRRCLLST
jgi:nicotinamide-nucleotide amidase